MKEIVIVGGGVAGVVAALALKGKCRVTLVEKERECGGLMRTFTNRDGIEFDYGTHVLSETGNEEIDALLFERIRTDAWRRFQVHRTASYFGGKLYAQSPHIDLRSLPPPLYARAVSELLEERQEVAGPQGNWAEQLTQTYGPTVTEYVHRPAMRKVFACELEDLLPDNFFALRRFVAFDTVKSRELKKDAALDAKLGFANCDDSVPTLSSYYPKVGAVGQWMENICDELKQAGVTLANGRTVAKIDHVGGEVNAIILDSGLRLPCDRLLWTASPVPLLRAMGLGLPSKRVGMRSVSFFHFCFDRPFLSSNYYVTNYDESFASFRITLYPNLQETVSDGNYRCTVEVIGDDAPRAEEKKIRIELEEMGLVRKNAKTISCTTDFLRMGFPIMTRDLQDASNEQVELVKRSTRRVELLGRAKGDIWSLVDIPLEAHRCAMSILSH